jgi:hypothetical protein
LKDELQIGEIRIDIVRKDIKNMHLAVYPPTGRVRIAVPLYVKEEAIRLFAISKLGWIKRHQRSFAEQERVPPREFLERESHYFQGRRYLLRIKETTGPARVEHTGVKHLDIYAKPDADVAYLERTLNAWYRAQLKAILPEMIAHWEQKMAIQVADWGIKRMKTKWGSCNIEARRIWLNLELAKKPLSCLEYILVHEMVHFFERHHNDRFRAHMDRFLPHWEQARSELNRLPVSHADWGY